MDDLIGASEDRGHRTWILGLAVGLVLVPTITPTCLPLVHEALGPEEEWRCRNEGRAMTEDEALAEARELAETLGERETGTAERNSPG